MYIFLGNTNRIMFNILIILWFATIVIYQMLKEMFKLYLQIILQHSTYYVNLQLWIVNSTYKMIFVDMYIHIYRYIIHRVLTAHTSTCMTYNSLITNAVNVELNRKCGSYSWFYNFPYKLPCMQTVACHVVHTHTHIYANWNA